MKIKCIKNCIHDMKNDPILYNDQKERVCIDDGIEPITIGKTYMVYGIFCFSRYPKYLICDDYYDEVSLDYPMMYDAPFFEVIDNS